MNFLKFYNNNDNNIIFLITLSFFFDKLQITLLKFEYLNFTSRNFRIEILTS